MHNYSPNTPGLRNLQAGEHLKGLIGSALRARDELPRRVPVLLKVAPDLKENEKQEITNVILSKEVYFFPLIIIA